MIDKTQVISLCNKKICGIKSYRTELALILLAIELHEQGIKSYDLDEDLRYE